MRANHISKRWISTWLIIGLLSLALASFANAQTVQYSIPRWSVNGGGGRASGAEYRLDGAIGQAVIGESTGVGYTVRSGFGDITPTQSLPHRVYLPLIIR
ncbi:MAG: hypothetical protein JXA21_24810 [Anaerolineae bacterium]|nr:hypothetical protein [Anaerolineae bacterium]